MGLGPSVPKKGLTYPNPVFPEEIPEAYWPYKRPHIYYYLNPKTKMGKARVTLFYGFFLIPGLIYLGIRKFKKRKRITDVIKREEHIKDVAVQREKLLALRAQKIQV